ncbi:hypothetical protein MPSEU_000609400 [Mayamaea pseudoterrestris]|nr:hypothetical protein MPSEU_000609400 [Mayamaea pseudoterrestris]
MLAVVCKRMRKKPLVDAIMIAQIIARLFLLTLTDAFYGDAPLFGAMQVRNGHATRDLHSRQVGYFDTSSIPLFMGKGDGKTKRKKKKPLSTASIAPAITSSNPIPASSSSQSQPLRVTNDINVPIRHQIQMARINKQLSSSGSSFRQQKRTAYRRSVTEEEAESKALERKRRGQDPDWDVILSRNRTSPLVIVDGYNIIHQWPRLKKHMTKGDTARARQLLIDDLENLRTIRGWRIEVVFDGTRRNTAGALGHGHRGSHRPSTADKQSKASISKHGVRVVYSGVGTEADTYIEARAHRAQNVTQGEMTSSFIIATDDSMIRLAGQNAGAVCMGAERFVNELKAAKESIGFLVEAAVARANGHVIRPEKLRSTSIHTFGRGSVLIEDKRNRTKARVKAPDIDFKLNIELEEKNGLHWAFVPPNRTNKFS